MNSCLSTLLKHCHSFSSFLYLNLTHRSFFQSLCVLGYCILPLTVAMIVCRIVLLGGTGGVSFAVRLVVVTASFGWSTFGKNQSKSFICFLLKLFRFLFIAAMFRIHVFFFWLQTSSSGSACGHHQVAV